MQPTLGNFSALPPASAGAKFRVTFLNATACYLVAYQLVAFAYQAGTALMARRLGVPGTWSLSGVRFELGDSGWGRTMVLEVYSAGPALILALGVLAFVIFWKRQRHRRGLSKLLLLWLVLHALNTLLGGLLADTVTQSGSWYVPNWLLGVGTWPSVVLGLLLGAGQLVLGYLAAIPFLLAQDSHTVLQFERRPQLVRATIFGPWLAGSALLAIGRLPYLSLNELLHYATMALLLVPLAAGCLQESFSQKKWTPSPTRVAWGLVGLATLALLGWRLALGGGVRI
ncbi:MAG: hypothetical protein ACRYFZ_19960 [Janthinobacterium lividum]